MWNVVFLFSFPSIFCLFSTFLYIFHYPACFLFKYFSFVTTCFQIHMKMYKVRYVYIFQDLEKMWKHLKSFFVPLKFEMVKIVRSFLFILESNNAEHKIALEIMRKFTEVLSSLKGDLTAGEQWLLRCIYVGGKNDLRMFLQNAVNKNNAWYRRWKIQFWVSFISHRRG